MSHDDLNDRSDQNDFLSGALHGAADAMPGGEVNDLHVSFGVVRDRVRRRRAVKVGSLAGASLAVAGVLAFGVTQSPVWNSEPVLPGSPSEILAPNRSAEPSPSGPPASSVIQDGYVPSWIGDLDVGLSCGMPVDDLGSTTDSWSATSIGDIYSVTSEQGGDPSTTLGMAANVAGTEGSLPAPPVLVWSQDGVVVDLGNNVFEGPTPREPLVGSAGDATEAQDNALTSCAPTDGDAGQVFQTPLPEGDYEVRVVAFPQLDSGDWATAVSEPVAVRLDADGAHSPTGTRGGDATIEPPERVEGELTRMVLDRSTSWVSARETHFGYITTGTPVITAECNSTDPQDEVSIEVVQPSTDESFATFDVPCDGERFVSPSVQGGGTEEVIDIRLASVPDGVSRFWATLAPDADGGSGGGDAAGACSADGLDSAFDPANAQSEAAATTAEAIVDAALACDQDRLVELANEYPTELMVTGEPAEQVFALPEDESLHYLTLVGLLTGTVGADQGDGTFVWPRVATDEFSDSNEAWQEVVDAGVLSQGDADAQRADEVMGYTGLRIAIDQDGNWRYYSATP